MADDKILLRREIRRKTATIPDDGREYIDAAIVNRMRIWHEYQKAKIVFMYVGIKNEISTLKMVESAYREGKIVALPKSFEDGVMRFYRYSGCLAVGKYGIPEPVSEEIIVPDEDSLMIVPGLAFDLYGYRLGQGGGYYDRYLSQYARMKTVGLCRSKFFFESLPKDWNDLPVDYVITEDDLFNCKEKRSF